MGNIVSYGRGLPIIVYEPYKASFKDVYKCIYQGYINYYGEKPSGELVFSWKTTLRDILDSSNGYPIIIEYPILDGLERVDYIIVGRGRALIVEAKSWIGSYRKISYYMVSSDLGYTRVDPCYQLENYVAKFQYLHSAGLKLEFDGIVYIHGFGYANGCYIVDGKDLLIKRISELGKPGGYGEVDLIVNGRFQISKTLVEYIKENKNILLESAIKALVGRGYGLTERQLLIVDRVLDALEKGRDQAFIVYGVSGSGKTLIALTLFFEALSRDYKVLLTYRNNRLLNTLRTALGGKITGLIKFYSTGPQGGYKGVAERNFPVNKYGFLDLVIYDEAQRMTKENIELSMVRSRVKVYLCDDEQVLIGDEEGLTRTFIDIAKNMDINYSFYELPRPIRIPKAYLEAVRNLLVYGRLKPKFAGLEFKVYDNIVDMINDLRRIHNSGKRVALVASFTETPGNKKERRAPDNLRIGYPLCMKYRGGKCLKYSDLDIYRDTGFMIYWLMHEKIEYPRYWMGLLDPLKYCASVYGAQGFEAEYVGVIWGRDLIWRNGRWIVNPSVITDYVGGRYSLKRIAKRDRDKAYRLLVNRYIILLTRGTKGVYVFFEDEETREYVRSLLT